MEETNNPTLSSQPALCQVRWRSKIELTLLWIYHHLITTSSGIHAQNQTQLHHEQHKEITHSILLHSSIYLPPPAAQTKGFFPGNLTLK